MATGSFDVNTARAVFPALQQKQIYMDNAGKWILGHEERKEYSFDILQEEAKYFQQWQTREYLGIF